MYRTDATRMSGAPRRLSWMTILIALVSLAFIAAAWVFVVMHAGMERREVIAAAIRANENRAVAYEQYVIRTLESADATTRHLIESYAGLEARSEGPRLIRDQVIQGSNVLAATITDASGTVVASSFPLPARPISLADSPSFRALTRGNENRLFIGRPHHSDIFDAPAIGVARRITRPDGSFGGIAGVQFAPSHFTDFYRQADTSPRDLVAVIGLDGVIRARRAGNQYSFGQDLTGFRIMDELTQRPRGSYLGGQGLDGVLRYLSYRRLADYPLLVAVGVARQDVLGAHEGRIAYYYLGAALLSILVLVLAFVLIGGLRRRQMSALALMDAKLRLEEAQRIGGIGDWIYDLRSGAITWSGQLFTMYERDPDEGPPTYEQVLGYFIEPGRAAIEQAMKAAVETGELQRFELTARLPSGRISHRHVLIIADKDDYGNVIGLRGTDQDISSRKLLENLQVELAHISRFDAMNTMAATLAHELNQPLTAAGNYMAGIKRLLDRRKQETDAVLADGICTAEKQIHLAGDIIRRVRDMIADRSAHYERARLADIVADASSLVAMANERPDMRIEVDLGDDAQYVRADMVQIQQVLINLIRNACEAVEASRPPHIRIASTRQSPDEVKLCVSDNGSGIPDSIKDLFSTFETSKTGGLGIGLSISRTIVEAHGGSIWVAATGGDGTTICFTLPGADAPA